MGDESFEDMMNRFLHRRNEELPPNPQFEEVPSPAPPERAGFGAAENAFQGLIQLILI